MSFPLEILVVLWPILITLPIYVATIFRLSNSYWNTLKFGKRFLWTSAKAKCWKMSLGTTYVHLGMKVDGVKSPNSWTRLSNYCLNGSSNWNLENLVQGLLGGRLEQLVLKLSIGMKLIGLII